MSALIVIRRRTKDPRGARPSSRTPRATLDREERLPLSPEEMRERALRRRDRRIRDEVEQTVREAGAKVFRGDPLRSARGTIGGAS